MLFKVVKLVRTADWKIRTCHNYLLFVTSNPYTGDHFCLTAGSHNKFIVWGGLGGPCGLAKKKKKKAYTSSWQEVAVLRRMLTHNQTVIAHEYPAKFEINKTELNERLVAVGFTNHISRLLLYNCGW